MRWRAYTEAVGHIHQKVRLRAEKTIELRMLVDTGATFSVIPVHVARELGIKKPRRRVTVRLADGRKVRLGADVALLRINGREVPTTILVGNVDEPILSRFAGVRARRRNPERSEGPGCETCVLGAGALEALGLVVDPRKKRLTPSRPYAVRLGGYR